LMDAPAHVHAHTTDSASADGKSAPALRRLK